MTPMHHSGKNDPIDIGQNFLEWLALLGWFGGQCGTNCTWFAVRRNAQRFYFSTITRDPIRQPMELFAEFLNRNVAWFVSHWLVVAAAVIGGSNPNLSAASDGGSYNDSLGMTAHN